nr:putative Gag-polypeptide of LTR copia-type [Tanacetum cinerariifolium]
MCQRYHGMGCSSLDYTTMMKLGCGNRICASTMKSKKNVRETSGVKLTDDLDGIGLISKGRRSDQKFNSSSSRIDKTKLKCEICGMTKHTKEQCFEIVGYPDWWVGNKKVKSGKAAATVGSQETIDSGSGSNTHQKELETPSTSREVNMATSGKKMTLGYLIVAPLIQ